MKTGHQHQNERAKEMPHRRFGEVLRDSVNEQVCEVLFSSAAGQRAVSPRSPGVSS